MNTWNYRVNAIFTLLSTVMFVLLGLNAATRPFLHQDPVAEAKLNQVLALYDMLVQQHIRVVQTHTLSISLNPDRFEPPVVATMVLAVMQRW
jgi:hypothetical protein